ncbi:SRPBCC domain-containing protein [uncultured Thermanaerothrix sp.]|uniref:SRPBCC domain-containing protein n=1 Tax=uncultured Thermanaerothrix sp. TaxID=1195149 RepID=UPI0026142C94|nr:SRPBCC domain-containing protein [uncultured Thermanaerothrix sp.]
MFGTIEIDIEIPVYPERIYRAWLDSFEHAQFTHKPARIEAKEGGSFWALDGRVWGRLHRIVPYNHITQSWQVQDEPVSADSSIEIRIEPTCTGSLFRVWHHGVKVESAKAMIGWWEVNYLRPLQDYFEALVGDYIADLSDG